MANILNLTKRLIFSGCIVALFFLPTHANAQSKPFVGMAGVWEGNGQITLDTGATESIRCKATYAVSDDGGKLQQTLRCASDSYNFNLRTDVVASGGNLSGNWSESTRNVLGSIEGRVNGSRLNVIVTSAAFTANLSLVTTGNKQNVTIKSEGTLRNVAITLARS
jgi:hypothetical protein